MTIVEALITQQGQQYVLWRKTYRWRWLAHLCNVPPYSIQGKDASVIVRFRTI